MKYIISFVEPNISFTTNQWRLVYRGCRSASLPEKCKAKDPAKRPNSP